MSEDRFEKGLAIRNQVMGKSYTERAFASPNPFDQDLQRILTELSYGAVWARDGLPIKTRSLITVAVLATLNRPEELGHHVRGALNLGLTEQEILEALMQILPYAGAPAMQGGVRTARAAFEEAKKSGGKV
ncbi:MAG: carboxymuconolactone decarboxylase family protein [Betaproteobacteria bacterium]